MSKLCCHAAFSCQCCIQVAHMCIHHIIPPSRALWSAAVLPQDKYVTTAVDIHVLCAGTPSTARPMWPGPKAVMQQLPADKEQLITKPQAADDWHPDTASRCMCNCAAAPLVFARTHSCVNTTLSHLRQVQRLLSPVQH